MEEQFGLKYKALIEELREFPDFESRGDALFFTHPDPEARMSWAFYRPSGSHPSQIEDSNEFVSIMAFNNSRLRPLERFSKLNKKVLYSPALRVKIAKRARMLFRALADEDFKELVEAVKLYPFYTELACDQVINGRKMLEEIKADIFAASEFLNLADKYLNDKLLKAVFAKLPDMKYMDKTELKNYLEFLSKNKNFLHPFILNHFSNVANTTIDEILDLHILQKKALQKYINTISQN